MAKKKYFEPETVAEEKQEEKLPEEPIEPEPVENFEEKDPNMQRLDIGYALKNEIILMLWQGRRPEIVKRVLTKKHPEAAEQIREFFRKEA
jgi:hypothetical protein